jgi:hypothetical protein
MWRGVLQERDPLPLFNLDISCRTGVNLNMAGTAPGRFLTRGTGETLATVHGHNRCVV